MKSRDRERTSVEYSPVLKIGLLGILQISHLCESLKNMPNFLSETDIEDM